MIEFNVEPKTYLIDDEDALRIGWEIVAYFHGGGNCWFTVLKRGDCIRVNETNGLRIKCALERTPDLDSRLTEDDMLSERYATNVDIENVGDYTVWIDGLAYVAYEIESN